MGHYLSEMGDGHLPKRTPERRWTWGRRIGMVRFFSPEGLEVDYIQVLTALNETESLRAELAAHQFIEWQATVDRDRALVEVETLRARLALVEKELGAHKTSRLGQCPMCYEAGYEDGEKEARALAVAEAPATEAE